MSFLVFDDKTPSTNANFKAIKAEEYLYKDPESGTYIPLVPGGGGGEVPYYAKPALVDFTNGSLRTTIDQTGLDVIDNAGNTASELTSTALTLGDLGGNASLGKAGIEAANNLKDAISGSTTDTTNANQSVLIYDASLAKVSKASTFRLNESATEFATLSPFAMQLKNGNTYNNMTTSGITTYYAPSNAISTLTGSTIAVGSRGGDYNLDTSLQHSKLSKTSLRLFDGTTTHTLDAPAIKAAANLATVTTTTPAPENKMVVFNPTTRNYAYHDVPAGLSLPAYILPSKIQMKGTGTSFNEKGIEIEAASGAGTKSSIKVTSGDSSATSPFVMVTGTGITYHPSSPDDFNDRTLTFKDVGRVLNGGNVLTANLYNNVAEVTTMNPLATYDSGSNTVSFTPGSYSTFNSVKLITSTIRAGDTVRLSFGSGYTVGTTRIYYIPVRFSSAGSDPFFTATSNAGYAHVIKANVTTGGGSTFTGIPVIVLYTLRTVSLADLRIDLVVHSLNRFPEVATVTL